MSGETAEITRVGGRVALSLVARIGLPLLLVGILGGVALNTRAELTAAALAEHKQAEEARLTELKADIRALRDELRSDLQNIRLALDRRR